MRKNEKMSLQEQFKGKLVEKVSQKVLSYGDPVDMMTDKCFLGFFFEPEMPPALLKMLNKK